MQKIHRIHFDSISSTNTWIKKNFKTLDATAITCVTATIQTKGRGRLGRLWISKAGNLHMSLFFCLEKRDGRIPRLAQLAAVALADLFPTQIKWPNDLIIDGKKWGGALVELVDCNQRQGVVLGLGLNVNTPVENTGQPTTSLVEATGQTWDLDRLVPSIIDAFFATLGDSAYSPPS